MEDRICPIHEDYIVSVCFFEGCNQHLLCVKCIKCHPDSHDSQIKSLNYIVKQENWTQSIEDQRDSQIAKLAKYTQQKQSLFDENQKILKEMVNDITECLQTRLCQWINELESSQGTSEGKQVLEMLEEDLKTLTGINFKEGDVYVKIDNYKKFTEQSLPKSMEICNQAQKFFDEVRIDQSKTEQLKQEIMRLIKSIQIQDLFTLSASKSDRTLAKQIEDLNQQISDLIAQNEQIEKLNKQAKREEFFKRESLFTVELDVKAFDFEQDFDNLATRIFGLEIDGLQWKMEYEIIYIAFSIRNLRISCYIDNTVVYIDDIIDKIQEWEEVQSCDIVSIRDYF